MNRRTKIIATLGPSSGEKKTIERLLIADVNVIRLNFSHGTHKEHLNRIAILREAAQELNKPITIMQDLQGPKIRTGKLCTESVTLVPGQSFYLATHSLLGDETGISVDYQDLPSIVQPGSRILLDDGKLELVVVAVKDKQVETEVIQGGELTSHKGVNLPGTKLNIRSFTIKDRTDLAFGLKQEIDVVAISFVQNAEDIFQLREIINLIAPKKCNTPIIAKLERPEALNNLHEIIEAADGVMVARGDLGVEMSPEAVPIAQKRIIEAANQRGKLVITATQMLDSMIQNPRPTRAEASDVANAIFDGTDAIMLSGETAVGKFPVKAVEMMDAIACQAEAHMDEWGLWNGPSDLGIKHDDAFYMTLAARELAHDRNVAAIAVFTISGRTALLMSKTRPEVPIRAFTPEPQTYNQLSLYWGVIPHLVPHANTIEEMIKVVESVLIESTPIEPGQQIVLLCGYPAHTVRPTNLALLHTVREIL